MADPFEGNDRPVAARVGDQYYPGPQRPAGNQLPVYVRSGAGRSVGHELAGNPVISGLVTGVRDVPIAGWLFSKALTESRLVDQRTLERMARVANRSAVGKGARFAGAFVPSLLALPKLYSMAGNVGVRMLGQAGPLAARVLGPGRLPSALDDVAAWSLDAGGAGALGKPALARAAEIGAGNVAIGSIIGAGELLEGESVGDAARSAALGAAIGMGADVGITLGAKALFQGARSRNMRAIKERAAPIIAKEREQAYAMLNDEIAKVSERLARAERFTDPAQLGLPGIAPRAPSKMVPAYKAKLAALEREREAIGTYFNEEVYANAIIRSVPKAQLNFLDDRAIRAWKTPEEASKELGVTGGRFMALAQDFIVTHRISDNLDHRELAGIGADIAAAFGKRGPRAIGWDYITPIIGVYQRDGIEEAIKAAPALVGPLKDPARLRKALTTADEFIAEHRKALQAVGGDLPVGEMRFWPMLIETEVPLKGVLGKLGIPQAPERVAKQLEASLQGIGMTEHEAKALASQLVFKERAVFKSPDILAGRLKLNYTEARAAGIPLINDPITSLKVWGSALNRKVAFETRFGRNGRLIKDVFKPAVEAEGGSGALFDLVSDSVTGHLYGTVMGRAAAAGITNFQVASRMSVSVIQNLSQGLNTLTQAGYANTVKGAAHLKFMRNLMRREPDTEAAMEGLAIADSVMKAWREVHLDQVGRTPLGEVAEWILNTTQFNRVESWNRIIGAAAAMQDVSKTLVRGIAGNLRGNNLDIARRRILAYGLDLDVLIAQGRGVMQGSGVDAAAAATQMLRADSFKLLKAAGTGGQRSTQFIPDPTRRPLLWNTPLGRVLTQFKNFAMSQTRFLRDRVVAEAAQGNYRPLAHFAMWAVPAGEGVRAFRSMVLEGGLPDQPRNWTERAIQDLMAVGGMGLGTELYRAWQIGPKAVTGSILGPTGSQLADTLGYALSGNFDQLVKTFGRLPTVRATANVVLGGAELTAEAASSRAMRDHRRALEHWLREPRSAAAATANAPTLRDLMLEDRGLELEE